MTIEPANEIAIKPMAVIYLRVSTKDQAGRGGEAEGFSIPAQREACMRKAEAMGSQVVGEFVDAGESARSANRPELQKMLGVIKSHSIAHVIVHKVDRLSRSRVDDVEINLQLQAAGAQLVSCTENIDETPSGMLLHGIMSSIAEFYSRNLATESKKGMLQKAKGGGTPGMAPFGYLNVRQRTDDGREARIVVPDPDRSQWAQWIFEQYATGEWTTPMLRDELNTKGITTVPRPNRPVRPIALSHISSILRNRYYVGVVTYEGVEYPGKHEALISEQLFDKAQRILGSRLQSGEKPRVHNHYLKGSIHCGQCGEALAFGRSRNARGDMYDYFFCLGRQRRKNGCEFRAVQVHVVEALVEKHWATITLSAAHANEIRRAIRDHMDKTLPGYGQKRESATAELVALNNESDRLLKAHLADAVTLDQLKREQARIAVERASIERNFSAEDMGEMRLTRILDYYCRLLGNAEEHYIQGDETIKRELNQSVFRRNTT